MLVQLAATLTLLAGAAPAPAPAAAAGGGKDALVARVVQAYGGREVLARARAFRQEGSVTSLLHPGTRGRIERTYARSGRLRVVTRYPGSPDEVIVRDAKGRFKDIQRFKRAHSADLKRKSKKESAKK